MSVSAVKFRKTSLGLMAALALAGMSLSGCVVYPSGYGYGYGYAPAYYAPPVYGSVVVGGGWGGWGGGGGRWR